MRKLFALILAVLLTLSVANLFYIFSHKSQERELVTVARVIDGDTIVLDDSRTVRLVNINSPEKNIPSSNLSSEYLSKYQDRQIEIESLGLEKYGRTLARIYSPDYINLMLVKEGLASKFLVNKNELKEFSDAEEEAIRMQKGMWKKSNYSECISAEVNAKEETALIVNSCPPISISGWILKDESRKTYKFNSTIKERVVLHSQDGQDSDWELYWGQGNVWNNDRDTLYLFDSEGFLVSHFSYGY